jgi:antitoxin (DNA-binding transcriptional repressor) of toxin-antitoxin stability system
MYSRGADMRSVTFTEFRKDASALFSAVENGEIIQVVRHGKPIAEILPFKDVSDKLPSWKKKRIKKSIKGEELSSIILSERESS